MKKANYVPVEKRSKKEQKALNAEKRATWGSMNPVTRRPQNPKAYDRKKSQAAARKECAAW